MIATILPSSSTFHAVAYNEKKVANGSASLLEMKGFGELQTFGYSSPDELTEYLIDYSSQNSRIKRPQFHVAISCKGNDYTPQQLVDIAHQWLDKMGYGDPDQPVLIYEHHDTDNTHIHVVTSRINPKGKKIDHNNERRRSQQVLDKIMRTDMRKTAEQDVQKALLYDFTSVSQFKVVMQAMNYECFEKNDTIFVKKGGFIQTTIDAHTVKDRADINSASRVNDQAELAKMRAIFKKYRDTNTSKNGLERDLHTLFGISLQFFGKADSPYGYAVVDHNKKKVYQGSLILGLKQLLDFRTPEEHFSEIEDFINNVFLQSPDVTTKQLNRKLGKFGAYIKKGTVCFGNEKRPMSEVQRAILKRNDKEAWRNGFNPQSEEERDLICKLTGYDWPNRIKIKTSPNGNYYTKDYAELFVIFGNVETSEKVKQFEAAGFKLVQYEGRDYVYRSGTQTIVALGRSGFDVVQYSDLVSHYEDAGKVGYSQAEKGLSTANERQADMKRGQSGLNTRVGSSGSHYANREWEVGKKGRDRDDMDNNTGVSY